jgi:hypothetical protein
MLQTFDRRRVDAPSPPPHDTLPKAKVVRAVARSASLYCEPFNGTLDDWAEVLAAFPDREIFQTPEWLRFIADSQGAQPVILTVKDGSMPVGYFAGLIVRRAGLRILGSPFAGWTTPRMGIRLLPNVSRRAAVKAVMEYAFEHLKCVHLELNDVNIPLEELAGLGFHRTVWHSYLLDLTQDEQAIYSRMSSTACRYRIRKAEKLGLVIEEAHDESFVDEYFTQLCDVFAKQSLVPTYDKERVRLLVRHLLPTGNLLLLRAREPQGRCVATSIFVGLHQFAYFWGNASWRQDQHFCPNESLQWYAIRYWKQRGVRYYDMGGGLYKRKYGGDTTESDFLWTSKYRWITWARRAAQLTQKLRQRLAGFRVKGKSPSPSKEDA